MPCETENAAAAVDAKECCDQSRILRENYVLSRLKLDIQWTQSFWVIFTSTKNALNVMCNRRNQPSILSCLIKLNCCEGRNYLRLPNINANHWLGEKISLWVWTYSLSCSGFVVSMRCGHQLKGTACLFTGMFYSSPWPWAQALILF